MAVVRLMVIFIIILLFIIISETNSMRVVGITPLDVSRAGEIA